MSLNAPQSRPITHKRVLLIALPIVLSNATVPLMGAVDTFVVGQMGSAAPIGAVGVGAVILSALYWIFGFLRMGTTGMVAQAVGAGDTPERDAHLSRALLIAFAAGLTFILLQIPLFTIALNIAPAAPEVEAMTREYLQIRIWGAPAAIAVYALTGWLIAVEDTRGVLILQLVMNLSNIALSLLFVLGFEWGVRGVALATLIGEYLGVVTGLILCGIVFRGTDWRDRARVLDPVHLKPMIAVNGDIMIRSVLLQICFMTLTFRAAALGTVTLAANQILLQFLYISAYALDGFAFAAEALVGGAMGARNRDVLRRASILSSFWALGGVVLLSIAFAVGGNWLISEMTTAQDVQAAARAYLPWMVLAPIVGLPCFMLDGIFIGATRSRDMRNMMIVSAVIYFAAIAVLVPIFGNHGLWAALMVFFVARGVTLFMRYPALERAASG